MDPDQDSEDDQYAYPQVPKKLLPPVFGPITPLEFAKEKLREFQDGPKIPRPSMAQTFIPVVGPAWEAAGDLQDGDYAGAGFNAAMAVADALPVGVAAKGIRAASKGIGAWKTGSVSANAAAKMIRSRGLVKGEEIHHTVPLNGRSRTAQDWRNHYAFLKTLPTEQHRRLTGSWKVGEVRKPQYDPIRRAWYGTTDWMKAVPTGLAGYSADALENLPEGQAIQAKAIGLHNLPCGVYVPCLFAGAGMNTSQVDFQFPLIGFTPDGDLWGFPDRNALTTCGPRTVKYRKPIGMELIDGEGRRWVVRDMWRLGRDRPLLAWLFWSLMTATPGSRIDYDLEALASLSLVEIKARAKAGIEAHPLNWCNPSEVETEIPARLAEVEAAKSVSDLFEVLGLDWFASY